MTPSQYGVLSVLLGIAYVLANILDLGITANIYSTFPLLIEKPTKKLFHFIKSTFVYQSIISIIIISLLIIFFPTLDKAFFKTSAPSWELYITAISILFFIWQNFILNIFYAAKRFIKANLYLNLANLGKTLILLGLIVFNKITVGSIIFTFGIAGPIIFYLLVVIDKKNALKNFLKADLKKEEIHLRYTFTYFLASQFFNTGTRMDLFLLSYFKLKNEVGFYGLSQKIILTILSSVISITQVLSPGFSKIKNKKQAIKQIKHGILYLLLPTGLFFLVVLIPNQIFYFIFTKKFAQTASITKILSLSYIVYPLASLPILFILYTIRKPGYILITNIMLFTIITLGSYLLIPKLGVYGPPYALFLSFVVAGLVLSLISVWEYKKLPS